MFSKLREQRNHNYIKENLSAYIDGELDQKHVGRVREHLEQCGECQRELALLRATVRHMHSLPRPSLPRSFVLAPSAVSGQRQIRRWDTSFAVLRGAAVTVSLMLVLLLSGEALLATGVLPTGMSRLASDEAMARPMVAQEDGVMTLAEPEEASKAAPLEMAPLPSEPERDMVPEKEAEVQGQALVLPESMPDPTDDAPAAEIAHEPSMIPQVEAEMAGEGVSAGDTLTDERSALEEALPPDPLPESLEESVGDAPAAAIAGIPDDAHGPAAMVEASPEELMPEEEAARIAEPVPQDARELPVAVESEAGLPPFRAAIQQIGAVLGGLLLMVLGGLLWVGHKRPRI